MGTVALDADIVIGFLDPADAQHDLAVRQLSNWLVPGHTVLMAASVYAETLVRPLQLGIAGTIDEFIDEVRIRVVPIDRDIARRAATLRAVHNAVRLPDAFALAIALEHHAQFLSLDRRLLRIARKAQSEDPCALGERYIPTSQQEEAE